MEEVLAIAKAAAQPCVDGQAAMRRAKLEPKPACIGRRALPQAMAVTLAVTVTVGSVSLLPMWMFIANTWATDPLRSIGAFFPALALLGVLARWRELGWRQQGSLWGLAVVGLAIPLARLVSVSTLGVMVQGDPWQLLHAGPALFLYGVGATLLFGGIPLLRRSIAPLCLLLAINPVPHGFNDLADMPLQELSAATARSFAHLIGLQPTGEQLRMMFAPSFGMLIVPGCNGVRGAITLAYLTLIFGYTRRLRPGRLAGAAIGALLLGYALNLLRLCVLVVYYRVGLSFVSIQKYGVEVDYAIGCSLVLLATVAIGLAVRRIEPTATAADEVEPVATSAGSAVWVRAGCFVALTMFFAVPQMVALATLPASRPDEQAVLRLFPAEVGPYRLVRTYAEHNGYGGISLGLGDYIAGADRRLTLGLWVESSDHMVASSRRVRGVPASWSGSMDASGGNGVPIHYALSSYDDGVSRLLDADTACSRDGCSDHVTGSGRQGYLFIGPRLRDLVLPPTGRRLPMILERESPESDTTPPEVLRSQFEEDVRLFSQQLDVKPLVEQAGSRP